MKQEARNVKPVGGFAFRVLRVDGGRIQFICERGDKHEVNCRIQQ